MANHLLMQEFIRHIIDSGYRDEYPHTYQACGGFFTFSPDGASAKVKGDKIPVVYVDTAAHSVIRLLQFRCSASIDPTTKKLIRNVYAFIEFKNVPEKFRSLCPKSENNIQSGIEIPIRWIIYPDFIGRRFKAIDGNRWNLRSKNVDFTVSGTVKQYKSAPVIDHRIGRTKRGCVSMNPPSSESVAEFSGMSSINRGDAESIPTIAQQHTPVAKKKVPAARTRKDPFFGMARSKDRTKIRLMMDKKHLGTFDSDENGIILMFATRDSHCSQNGQSHIPHPNLTQINLWLEKK